MVVTESKQNKFFFCVVAWGLITPKHTQHDQQVQSISIKANSKQSSEEQRVEQFSCPFQFPLPYQLLARRRTRSYTKFSSTTVVLYVDNMTILILE